jgi:hypothetical protein
LVFLRYKLASKNLTKYDANDARIIALHTPKIVDLKRYIIGGKPLTR